MKAKIRSFFKIPPSVLPEFRQTAFHRNQISMLVMCIMIFGMELFNMSRVLFWSKSGLGTLNNRIYFGMYLSLFLAAALYLILHSCVSRSRLRFHLAVQYGAVLFFLLWHASLNAYDLMRNPNADLGIYYTAVLGVAVFILMPAWTAAILHTAAYVLFMGLAGSILTSGDRINVTFTAIVALAVSMTNSYHHMTIVSQRQEISKMNEMLLDKSRRDALTGLLNKSAFQHCAEPFLNQKGIMLLIADLDNFKTVNDQYGHPCGDFVLKEMALQMEAAFPDAIGISRIGGDEFAILTREESSPSPADAAAALIRSVSQITWHGRNVSTGCSIGCCCIGLTGVSFEHLYSQADRALYQAKKQGKQQLHVIRLP